MYTSKWGTILNHTNIKCYIPLCQPGPLAFFDWFANILISRSTRAAWFMKGVQPRADQKCKQMWKPDLGQPGLRLPNAFSHFVGCQLIDFVREMWLLKPETNCTGWVYAHKYFFWNTGTNQSARRCQHNASKMRSGIPETKSIARLFGNAILELWTLSGTRVTTGESRPATSFYVTCQGKACAPWFLLKYPKFQIAVFFFSNDIEKLLECLVTNPVLKSIKKLYNIF